VRFQGPPLRIILLTILLGAAPWPSVAQGAAGANTPPRWTAELSFGDAYNFPTRLDVHQIGYPVAIQHATYETRGFELPIYWALRATRWQGTRAWAIELLHHKLVLADPMDPVDDFSITHGFNLLTVGYLIARGDFHAGVAGGGVIAHPENRVRGFELSSSGGVGGYYLAGPTGALLVGWHRDVGRRVFVGAEGRFMASYAHVPIFDGHASVVHLGLHGHLAVGYALLP